MSASSLENDQPYCGPLKAVILDWAGTAVDYGCFGPVAVFQKAFQHFGVNPSIKDIRAPMGREKKAHVRQMLGMSGVRARWRDKYRRDPVEADLEALFAKVMEIMPETLALYSDPVPGCAEALRELRARGIAIGSCTGYNRAMMRELIPAAAGKGFDPDFIAASDDVPQGRPYPWMCRMNCVSLGVSSPEAVVKAGDTVMDIQEGINAGHWTVAMTRSSSAMGMSPEEIAALSPEELYQLEAPIAKAFSDAGAHYVISDISMLPKICDDINQLLLLGFKP